MLCLFVHRDTSFSMYFDDRYIVENIYYSSKRKRDRCPHESMDNLLEKHRINKILSKYGNYSAVNLGVQIDMLCFRS